MKLFTLRGLHWIDFSTILHRPSQNMDKIQGILDLSSHFEESYFGGIKNFALLKKLKPNTILKAESY